MRGGVSIIQTYLRLPDMERVTFIGFFPISILDNYFEDCSRNITALSLNLRNIGNPPEPVPTRTLIDQQRPKIQLSHLYLFNSKIMTQWLLQRNTFAFSCLRSVEMDDQTWVSLQDSLKSSLRSIESLILTNFTNPTHLDLTKLPALRLLDVCIRPDHHEWLMSTLLRPSAHPNLRIITIRIDIQIYEEYSYTFERFRSNASAIAAVHPVQRVDFHHNTNLHQKESMKSFFASDVV
ncbi:hypothetical protein B0H16DRAFT_1597960 [Mycena metata]|uniref:Uncharacterized protein n=1 Tax=Mycena metata TaxID=1033252 RepID=A0AAD7MMF8_9AGAR|nr:hypothetical protein B0H16DRAFT_1597960 [Mycena metata]